MQQATPFPRRKLSNLVIDRAGLARLSIPFLIMIAISLTIVFVIRWKVMQTLEQTELQGVENLPAINKLHELQSWVTAIGTYGLLALTVICFGLWIIFSHRIFGPTVPIRRHIHKLNDGDYSSRIKLRPRDEFKDLVEDLNHLAETLAANHKDSPRSANK